MPTIDCVPVNCGGCGGSIWVTKEYSLEPMCWECRERLAVGVEAEEAPTTSEAPSAPVGPLDPSA